MSFIHTQNQLIIISWIDSQCQDSRLTSLWFKLEYLSINFHISFSASSFFIREQISERAVNFHACAEFVYNFSTFFFTVTWQIWLLYYYLPLTNIWNQPIIHQLHRTKHQDVFRSSQLKLMMLYIYTTYCWWWFGTHCQPSPCNTLAIWWKQVCRCGFYVLHWYDGDKVFHVLSEGVVNLFKTEAQCSYRVTRSWNISKTAVKMMENFDSEDDNISRASSNRWSVMAFELPGSDILKTGYLKKLKV